MTPMIFEAFLVIAVTISGPAGITRDLTRMYPMPSMEVCAAYINDPAQIESNFHETFTIKSTHYGCVPRNPGRKNGVDPAPV